MAPRKKKGKQSSPEREATAADAATPWPDVPKQLNSEVARNSTLMKNFNNGGVTKSWSVSSNHRHSTANPLPLPQLYDITCDDGSYDDSMPDSFFDILFRGDECWWYRWGITPHKYQNQHRRFHLKGYFHSAENIPSDQYDVGLYWWYRFNTTPREYYCYYRRFHYRGYSHGVLVGIKDTYPGLKHFLWDPMIDCTWVLPHWDENLPFKRVALSSSPSATNSCFVVVLTGMSKPAFVFCRLDGGFSEWVKVDCTLVDPYSSNRQLMEFTNVIGFQGKFYALSLQGTLVVIEADTGSELRITGLGKTRAVPSVQSKHFREYLLESNGEILLIYLISRKLVNVVDSVEVYRLVFDRLVWEKLERLGDRTLFMGSNCCACIVSSRVGFRSNCVYFSHGSVEGRWCVYEMKMQTISSLLEHQ